MQEALRNTTARITSAEKEARESLGKMEASELPPSAEAVVTDPKEHSSGIAAQQANKPATPQEQAIVPATAGYLAQARRAALAATESDSDTSRRSRRIRIPSEDREPERKGGTRRPLATAAAVLLLASSGYYVVSWEIGAKPVAVVKAMPVETAALPNPVAQYGMASLSPAPGPAPLAQPSAPVAEPTSQSQPAATSLTLTASLAAQALAGDMKAASSLGLKYADGDGVSVNEPEAVRWLTKAATAGDPIAAYRLGTLYERGRGVAINPKQAIHWYGEAAKSGNRRAMHNLAAAYAGGANGEKNFSEAARWFKAAAELGLADSQFNIAVLYERGLGVKQSLSEAYKWYAIAAAFGDEESKSRVAALVNQLPPAEREAAERAAKTYKPQPISVVANGN